MPTDKKKKTLRSSTGKVVKNISDKKNASILKSRTTRKKGVGRRVVREGYTGSGKKTGRAQYVNRDKAVKSKGLKAKGVKKATPKAKAKVMTKKKK